MALDDFLRQPKVDIGLRAFEAKQYIVRAILDEFYDQVAREIIFESFFQKFTEMFRQEDFLMRLRSCYSCIGRIAPDVPIVMKDKSRADYSFHDNCLCKECVKQMNQDLVDGKIDLKPN